MSDLLNMSASLLRKMFDEAFPDKYPASKYVRKSEMIRMLLEANPQFEESISSRQRYNACFHSRLFDIDKCVAGIVIPDEWEWIGVSDKYMAWMQYVIDQDVSKQNLICNLKFNETPTIYTYPDTRSLGEKYYVGHLHLSLRLRYQIYQCKSRLIVIPLAIDRISGSINKWSNSEYLGGHLNIVIIDKDSRTVERFEPHGSYTVAEGPSNKLIDDSLRETMVSIFPGYTFISTLDFCPSQGPLTAENVARNHGFVRNGFCVAFSMLYFHLRLSYPNKDRSEIVSMITLGGPLDTYDRIVKYAYLIDIFDEEIPRFQYGEYILELKNIKDIKSLANKLIPIIDNAINAIEMVIGKQDWNLFDINEEDLKSIQFGYANAEDSLSKKDEKRIKLLLKFDENGGILYADDNFIFDVVVNDQGIYPLITADGIDEQTRINLQIYIAGRLNMNYRVSWSCTAETY